MYILGISAFYHDSAACLIKDGEIVAAVQEERFTRIKNDPSFPIRSIKYCLSEADINLSHVDHVVFYEKPFLKFERLIETYLVFAPLGFISFIKAIPLWLKEKLFQKTSIIKLLKEIDQDWNEKADRLLFAEHHQSHAASAFFPSPYQDALVLTLDGVGEWTTTAVWKGVNNKLELLQEIKFPHSLGLLYSAFTYYLGFKVNFDEYKLMGLAPYGEPVYADLILKELIDLKPDGSFRLNLKYFGYCTGLKMTNNRFNRLFGEKPRKRSDEITKFHMDVASSVQQVTETVVLRMLKYLRSKVYFKNLCLAGGVALNCVINGRILQEKLAENVWIQPAAGDAGGAIGAAFYVYHQFLNFERSCLNGDKMKQALLGPSFTTEEVADVLSQRDIQYRIVDEQSLNKEAARLLDNGKVIGWFKGRMEFGPRALGSRSILADCRKADMQSTLNLKVKFRESFRPFATAILLESMSQYFNLPQSSPYMSLVDRIKPEQRLTCQYESAGFDRIKQCRSVFPATTHVDFSSRIQTVEEGDNSSFYQLLKTFYELTGCPAIINTSFNVMDEPIVCTPEDAINCFLKTGLDVLIIENIIVTKESVPTALVSSITDKNYVL